MSKQPLVSLGVPAHLTTWSSAYAMRTRAGSGGLASFGPEKGDRRPHFCLSPDHPSKQPSALRCEGRMIIGVNCSTKSCKVGPRGRTKAGEPQTTPTEVPLALLRPRAQEAEHTDGPGSTPSPGRRELLVARANSRSRHHNYGCCGQFYVSAWPC